MSAVGLRIQFSQRFGDLRVLIAIYGAVVATAVAIWNAYTWRRGNRLHLTGYTSADMAMDLHTAMKTGADPAAKYVALTVGNRGLSNGMQHGPPISVQN